MIDLSSQKSVSKVPELDSSIVPLCSEENYKPLFSNISMDTGANLLENNQGQVEDEVAGFMAYADINASPSNK